LTLYERAVHGSPNGRHWSRRREEPVGFFEQFKVDEGGTGEYVKEDEKNLLIANKTPFSITAVTFGKNPFAVTEKDGTITAENRYVVTALIDGAERRLSFVAGSVDSRDRLLSAMAEYLEDGGEAPTVALERAGRAVLIVPA
jgi:hypothetical protein